MKKIISVVIVVLMLFVSASAKILPREDIPLDTGAEGMARLGILKGTDKGYELEREVTRAEALTFIWRTTGVAFTDIGADLPFEDVSGHWAEDTILKFYINGFINGTSEKTFEPQRTVTGKEFVKILLSVMGYEGVSIENAFEIGKQSGLIMNNFTETVVYENHRLIRSDVTRLCHSALLSKCPDGVMLYKKLIERGLYTHDDFEGILFCGTPAKSYFADKLNAGMNKSENYMFSPLSIKMALAFAANGAEGETLKEISEITEIFDVDEYNEKAKALIDEYANAKSVSLNVANSIWLNKDESTKNFSGNYKLSLKDFYGATSGEVTNKNAVKTINDWVNEKTKGEIPEIISSSDFWTALVNAVYFKGGWQDEFMESVTSEGDFQNADGTIGKAMYMKNIYGYGYFGDENTTLVNIPYKNYIGTENGDYHHDDMDISMYVMMTDAENKVAELENLLGLGMVKHERIELYLPKFKIETSIVLNDILKNAGIVRAFDKFGAQFEKMFDKKDEYNMYIDTVLHKTYIDVDEKGTEAAAVTAIMMAGAASAPKEPKVVKFDKPFTFIIRDNQNEEILFMGEYLFAER